MLWDKKGKQKWNENKSCVCKYGSTNTRSPPEFPVSQAPCNFTRRVCDLSPSLTGVTGRSQVTLLSVNSRSCVCKKDHSVLKAPALAARRDEIEIIKHCKNHSNFHTETQNRKEKNKYKTSRILLTYVEKCYIFLLIDAFVSLFKSFVVSFIYFVSLHLLTLVTAFLCFFCFVFSVPCQIS